MSALSKKEEYVKILNELIIGMHNSLKVITRFTVGTMLSLMIRSSVISNISTNEIIKLFTKPSVTLTTLLTTSALILAIIMQTSIKQIPSNIQKYLTLILLGDHRFVNELHTSINKYNFYITLASFLNMLFLVVGWVFMLSPNGFFNL